MEGVSGDADPFAPSDPQAPADHEAITDRSGFVARVGPSVDRAHDVAHDIVGDPQVAADVVRDVFEAFWARNDELTDDELRPESILLATRSAALTRRSTQPTPAGARTVDPDQPASASRHRVELAQAGAAVLGADDTSALDLHLRHGVAADTLAPTLGVSDADAPRRLARLRSRLDDALAAFTLWRGGDPACAELAAALHDGTTLGGGAFDIVAFDAVETHRATCAECSRRHRAIVNPAGMFATAPVVTVARGMRDRMLSPSDTISLEPVVPVSRRHSDDTPTALLWAAAEPPVRPRTPAPPRAVVPVIETHRGDPRRVIAGIAAAVLLLGTAGAVFAVRGSSGGGDDSTDPTTTTTPTESTEPEVRALGPVPPVVVTTATTSTVPPETTEPDSSAPETSVVDTSAPETTGVAAAPVTTVSRRSSPAPIPTAAVTTTSVTSSGTPIPPPTTATTTTTTTSPTTTQTTAATTTTTTTAPTTTAVTTTVATTTAPTTAPPTTAAPTTAATTTVP